MRKTDQKKALLAALLRGTHSGKSKAISGADLAKTLHISKSELHRKVNRLRQERVPICSGPWGYFYAVTAGDIYDTIRFLRKIIAKIEAAIKGLEEALKYFGETQDPGGDPP